MRKIIHASHWCKFIILWPANALLQSVYTSITLQNSVASLLHLESFARKQSPQSLGTWIPNYCVWDIVSDLRSSRFQSLGIYMKQRTNPNFCCLQLIQKANTFSALSYQDSS